LKAGFVESATALVKVAANKMGEVNSLLRLQTNVRIPSSRRRLYWWGWPKRPIILASELTCAAKRLT